VDTSELIPKLEAKAPKSVLGNGPLWEIGRNLALD